MQIILMISLIYYLFKSIRTDCGPPGKASGSDFSPHLSKIFPELFEITYRCKENLRLFSINDEFKRFCLNGTWNGDIPKCAKRIDSNENLKHYEILNNTLKVKQISYKWSNEVDLIYRIGLNKDDIYDYIDKCSEMYGNMQNNQTWIFDILDNYYDVRYSEIIFIGWPLVQQSIVDKEIIQFGYWSQQKYWFNFQLISINQFKLAFSNQTLTRIKFFNPLINSSFKPVKCGGRRTSAELPYPPTNINITLSLLGNRFAGDISFCAIDLYSESGDCGTPDIPLHSKVIAIDFSPPIECFRIECEKNYKLVGHSDIDCSKYGKWIGETPLCVPNITCRREMLTNDSLLEINYMNTETINNQRIAIIDSVEFYSCKGTAILYGKTQRNCLENGTWDAIQPKCMLPPTQTSLSFITITLSVILFCTIIAFAIALGLYIRKINRIKLKDQTTVDYYDDMIDNKSIDEDYQQIDTNNENHYYNSVRYERIIGNSSQLSNPDPIYLSIH